MTRLQLIKHFERVNRRFEVRFYPKVLSALNAKKNKVIRILKQDGYSAANYYLTTEIGNIRMAEVIKEIYTFTGRRWAQIEYGRLLGDLKKAKSKVASIEKKGFGFNYAWTKFILDYLEKYLFEKITFEINKTTQDAMLRVISRAVAAGWSIEQTVDRFEDWPFLKFQAARILRTEVNRAANVGSAAQAETSEFEQMKEWQSAEDHRVRGSNPKDHADHVALDGVKINADDVFYDPRNGDQLQFPGDPKASAASVINCRCHASFTFKRDKNDNLIPKRKTTTVIFPGQIRSRQTITI
jgi:hypothetical protein